MSTLKLRVRSCRVCGCTDTNCRGCVERTGRACHWIAGDLCSACVGPAAALHAAATSVAKKLTGLARKCSLNADRGYRPSGEEMENLAVDLFLYADALTRAVERAKEGGAA